MVEITEIPDGVTVEGTHYYETFRNRFKALMAAHAVALGEATSAGSPVIIYVPKDWGDPIVIDPCTTYARY